jgi:hypothetical protein
VQSLLDANGGMVCGFGVCSDLRSFTFFGKTKIQRVTVVPGDVLYIPPFWFHEVISLVVFLWSR